MLLCENETLKVEELRLNNTTTVSGEIPDISLEQQRPVDLWRRHQAEGEPDGLMRLMGIQE